MSKEEMSIKIENSNSDRAFKEEVPVDNPNQYDGQNEDDGTIIKLESNKGKRRSKNDNDGRNHICKLCNKAYLSYPALYTHMKTKHQNDNPSSSKGRGRPKKDNPESVYD
jgi:hypothetical protein